MKSLKELLGLKPEVITVTKEVEKIVEVEKRVEVPVEKIVEKEVVKEVLVEKTQSSPITYHLLPQSLIVSFNGQRFSLAKDDGRYSMAAQAIKEGRLEDIPGIVDVRLALKKSGFELDKDGKIMFQDEEMPKALMDKISTAKENGWPIDVFFKFWENLKQNPNPNSIKMLYKFLEHNGHPLTNDGCFIGYRKVRKDFKDIHSGKFDNSPGKVLSMPRNDVDSNPNSTCSTGLHVASWTYLPHFGNSDSTILEVKVNPRDVVAVPVDYNGTKMRVCKFEVIRVCEEIQKDGVYAHDKSAKSEKFLVRLKGEKKWTTIEARDMRDAAETVAENSTWFYEGEPNTVYVRKGSNYVESFDF